MKKNYAFICFSLILLSKLSFAQTNQTSVNLGSASILNQCSQVEYDKNQHPYFLTFQEKAVFKADKAIEVLKQLYDGKAYTFQSFKKENDGLGFTHEKFSVLYQSLPISGAIINVHSKNGKITSINGQLSPINAPINISRISTASALQFAKTHLKVKKLKIDNTAELAHYRKLLNDPLFSFEPKVEPIIFFNETKSFNAFKVSFYSEEPLFNGEVYIDAQTGELLGQYNKVCTIDVPASGNTQYNGTQNFTNDQFAGGYRLRESQRGLGIETYKLNNTTNYSLATDVVNATVTWTTAGIDSTAIGAHWATEKTYDYFFNVHNRNSIDNNGYKLISYVHYGNNFGNAFWNGQFMTYGDGDPSVGFRKMASLDVCGHEVTHGLVQNTGALGQGAASPGEPNALNEAWSDIMGTSIERNTLPSTWDWILGKDLTLNGNGIRNMQNPNSLSNPDTYGGTFWDFQLSNIHSNGCVAGFWFYLLCNGGSGTNDLNNSYTITALSNLDAEKIAFRALSVYFTPTTNFAAARLHTIQAAKDLFGACSNQLEQVIRAWYAVGVGSNFSGNANPSFFSNNYSCSAPATISFVNTTSYAFNYNWSFGDGTTSNVLNPTHTYTAGGVYTVKLYATGCNNLLDSIVKTAYVTVNIPQAPTANAVSICANSSASISAIGNGTIQWFSNPNATGLPLASGSVFVTPTLTTNTSYYLLSQQTPPPFYGGLLSNTLAATTGTFLNSGSHSLVFDVVSNCVLNSVVIYAQTAGSRFVLLRNSANNLINSLVVSLVPGANTIALNFPLSVGQNFKLNLTAGSGQSFFTTTSGVNYPYPINGCLNITGSSLGSNQYPWFYNWEVEKSGCVSGVTSVNVNVNANPSASITVSNNTVCPDANVINLNGLPTGGNYSGIGVSGSVFTPSVGAGVYPINYIYTNSNGCSDTSQISISVESCVSVKEQTLANLILVYPNPTHSNCIIKNESGKIITIHLIDISGKILKQFVSSEKEFSFLVNDLAKGIYTLNLSDSEGTSANYKIVVN
jgi:Zn-dependent metalloprotease